MIHIHRLDAWIAKRVMHPPIIWICQRVGINQFAFYRFGWMLVGLHALWLVGGRSTGWMVFLVLFALSRVLSAGIHPDRPASPSFGLRVFFAGVLVTDTIAVPFGYPLVWSDMNMLLALVAEYALTIVTIPPRKLREPVVGVVHV